MQRGLLAIAILCVAAQAHVVLYYEAGVGPVRNAAGASRTNPSRANGQPSVDGPCGGATVWGSNGAVTRASGDPADFLINYSGGHADPGNVFKAAFLCSAEGPSQINMTTANKIAGVAVGANTGESGGPYWVNFTVPVNDGPNTKCTISILDQRNWGGCVDMIVQPPAPPPAAPASTNGGSGTGTSAGTTTGGSFSGFSSTGLAPLNPNATGTEICMDGSEPKANQITKDGPCGWYAELSCCTQDEVQKYGNSIATVDKCSQQCKDTAAFVACQPCSPRYFTTICKSLCLDLVKNCGDCAAEQSQGMTAAQCDPLPSVNCFNAAPALRPLGALLAMFVLAVVALM